MVKCALSDPLGPDGYRLRTRVSAIEIEVGAVEDPINNPNIDLQASVIWAETGEVVTNDLLRWQQWRERGADLTVEPENLTRVVAGGVYGPFAIRLNRPAYDRRLQPKVRLLTNLCSGNSLAAAHSDVTGISAPQDAECEMVFGANADSSDAYITGVAGLRQVGDETILPDIAGDRRLSEPFYLRMTADADTTPELLGLAIDLDSNGNTEVTTYLKATIAPLGDEPAGDIRHGQRQRRRGRGNDEDIDHCPRGDICYRLLRTYNSSSMA